MKVNFNIPTDKTSIALREYQEFDKVKELNKDSEDGAFLIEKMVSIFCGVDMKDLRKIQYSHYELIVEQLAKAFDSQSRHRQIIKLAGQEFGMIPNFDKMSFGEYVDLDEYSKEVKDYHKFMAVLYRPITMKVGDTYQIEEYKGSDHLSGVMLEASLADVEGALLFFWTLAKEFLTLTTVYLQEELMKISMEKGQSLEKSTDGINPLLLSQTMTSLKSALSQSSIFTNVFTNSSLIRNVWKSNKEKLKELEISTSDEAVL